MRLGVVLAAAAAALLIAIPSSAPAAKRVVAECGGTTVGGDAGSFFMEHGAVAVSRNGAGEVVPGTVYVAEGTSNARVQQITPSCGFVRMWGIDVIKSGAPNDGGEGAFEICDTTADPPNEPIDCKGSQDSLPAHPGSVGNNPEGLAVEQATGRVYLADQGFNRVAVFSATGQPLGAFGWGVRDGAEALQHCTVASGCRAGDDAPGGPGGELSLTLAGGGIEISPAGEIYIAGPRNRRVDVFEAGFEAGQLSEASFRRALGWDVVREGPGDSEVDERARLAVRGTAGTYFLRVREPGNPSFTFDTETIAHDASAAEVEAKLNTALEPAGGEVTVSGGPGDETGSTPYEIEFGGSLGGDDVTFEAFCGKLSGGSPTPGCALEVLQQGGAYEACTAADGDECKRGAEASEASEPGHFNGTSGNENPRRVAIDPASEDLYVLDARNGATPPRIHRFDSDGTPLEGAFGAAAIAGAFGADADIEHIAIDPDTGHLLLAGSGEETGGQARVLELGPAGEAIEVHGPELSVAGSSVQGIATAPQAAGGNLFLSIHSPETLVGVYVLAEEPPQAEAQCHATTATLTGEVFSEGKVASYRFEYVSEERWEESGFEDAAAVPVPDGLIGPAPGYIAVGPHEATGLTGKEPYRFRLVATKDGIARSSATVACTTEAAPPAISAAGVLADESTAVLKARVNPQNEPATYRFQYTTEADFEAEEWAGATSLPVPDGEIAAADRPLLIAQEIEGLEPATAYRSRLIAANETFPGETSGAEQAFATLPEESPPPTPPGGCPNEALRGGPSGQLPDCRAYELVSPPGAANLTGTFNAFVSDGGEHVSYRTLGGAFAGIEQNSQNAYASHRGAAGWSTTPLAPPLTQPTSGGGFNLFGNFVTGVSDDFSRAFVDTENAVDPADADEARDLYLRRAGGEFEWLSRSPLGTQLGANSADARRALLFGAGGTLWEWVEGTPPTTRLASVLPGGGACEAALAGSWDGAGNRGNSVGAMSADGTRIFFSCEGALYVREGGAVTREIAAPATYYGASREGSRVFFSSTAPLVGEDTNGAADLYRYDLDTDTYTRLTVDSLTGAPDDPRPRTGTGAGVVASRDGSRAYFVARGVLTESANANGQLPADGIDNVYLWDRGTLRFVASPQSGGVAGSTLFVRDAAGSVPTPNRPAEWDVSADGGYLALASSEPLLAADTDSRRDVYVYDLAARRLSLATTGPRGGNGAFDADMAGGGSPVFTRRPLALGVGPAGAFLFFQTEEALVARDLNDKADVYQRDLASGRTWLISSGSADGPARLIGASADGRSVAFIDPLPLAPHDTDGEPSVYVARAGGGFPAPAAANPCIAAETCRGALAPDPPPGSASSRFRGPGNLQPATGKSCRKHAKRARRRAARARKARRAARRAARAGAAAKARRLRGTSRRLARSAKRQSAKSKRCRRATRRAAR